MWYERPCKSCEVLQSQLDIVNAEKQRILDTLLELHRPVIEERTNTKDIEPIKSKIQPWSIQRRLLEEEDRVKAKVLRERLQIDELEKELKIDANVQEA